MAAGRPPIFESLKELEEKINEYFVYIQGEKNTGINEGGEMEEWRRSPETATVTGLALFLGFESRQSFYDYEGKEEFSYTIRKARLKVENEYEKKLSSPMCTGAIFALKNHGWRDKVETGFTDKDGNDLPPVQILLPDNGRTKEKKEIDNLYMAFGSCAAYDPLFSLR